MIDTIKRPETIKRDSQTTIRAAAAALEPGMTLRRPRRIPREATPNLPANLALQFTQSYSYFEVLDKKTDKPRLICRLTTCFSCRQL